MTQHNSQSSLGAKLDQICDRFETAWNAEQRPRIEDFLNVLPDDHRSQLFRELLQVELELRQRSGEKPNVDEYSLRFSEHSALITDVFAKHVAEQTPSEANEAASTDDSGLDDATLPPEQNSTTRLNGIPSDDTRSFGDYELIDEIARGGMGVVFRARQVSLNRPVALKMILAGQFASGEEIQRFQTEAEAAAKLDHPSIVPIYEISQQEGHHFFSMKLIEGQSLAQCTSEYTADHHKAVELMCKLARAVHHAHQRGILHRDLKPGNVLLDQENEPHITDFGLARQVESNSDLTRTGAVLGTPAYMPPEQAQGDKQLTTAADIYSLGAILYELLTGQRPFRASNPIEIVMKVLNEAPKPPSEMGTKVDRGLELICLTCLDKEPDNRYESAEALARDLERWMADEPLTVRAPSLMSLMRFWLRQNFGRAGWMLVIGLAIGIVSGVMFWMGGPQEEIAHRSQVYDHLPNVQKPWLLNLNWLPPLWLRTSFLFTSIVLHVYLGFLCAAMVRPKNRWADAIAGSVTSSIAGFALFLSVIGPVSVKGSLDHDDQRLLRNSSVDLQAGLAEIVETYPDLETLPPDQRIQVINNKIIADQLATVPVGIWSGIFVSFSCCLILGVGEAMVAGPIVREQERWLGSLVRYSEICIPAGVIVVVGLLLAITPLVTTYRWAVVDGFRLGLLIGLGCFAVWGVWRSWHWAIRLPIQICFACVFIAFMRFDFLHMNQMGRLKQQIVREERVIDEQPESVEHQLNLGMSYAGLGYFLYDTQRWKHAKRPHIQAIEIYDKQVDALSDRHAKNEAIGHLFDWKWRLSEIDDRLGNHTDARATLMQIAPLEAKAWRSFSSRLRQHVDLMTKAGQLEHADAENYLERFAREVFSTYQQPPASTEQYDNWSSQLARWMMSKQHWRIIGPFEGSKDSQSLDTLFGPESDNAERNSYETVRGATSWATVTVPPSRYVDLKTLFDPREHVVAYAATVVESPVAQQVMLVAGNDDGCKIWLNDELMLELRSYAPFQNHETVQLKKGRNAILVKVDQQLGEWGFTLDFITLDGWPVPLVWHSTSGHEGS